MLFGPTNISATTGIKPPYDQLDKLLAAHIEEGLGAAVLKECGFDAQTVDDVLKAVRRSEYKRRCEPIAPYLGGVSLTSQRSWPITCGWDDSQNGKD